MGTETRQRNKQIKVRLNEAEYSSIVAISKQHNLAPSTFLLKWACCTNHAARLTPKRWKE